MLFPRLFATGGTNKKEYVHIADAHIYNRHQIRKARLGGRVKPSDFVDPMFFSGIVSLGLGFLVWCTVRTLLAAHSLTVLAGGFLGLVVFGILTIATSLAFVFWAWKFAQAIATARADISMMQVCSTDHWPLYKLVRELGPDWDVAKVAMTDKTDLGSTLSRVLTHFINNVRKAEKQSEPVDVVMLQSAREVRRVLKIESKQHTPTPTMAT